MIKKLFTFFTILLILVINFVSPASATDNIDTKTTQVLIEVLARPDCPHCQDEEQFLNQLKQQRTDFTVNIYNILDNPEHKLLWEQITVLENIPKVTPITLIGKSILVGFATPDTTGKQIQELIDQYKGQPQITIQEFISAGGAENIQTAEDATCGEVCVVDNAAYYVNIPFYGSLNVKQYSLPILSIILGFIDGFNPCAMWVLVSFLIILAQVGDRRKMWLFAGSFIFAEAIMYTLILTVWYTAWDFVGLDQIITPIVGLVAIGGGIFFLYEWKTSDPGECKVTNLTQRQKTSQKIKELASQPFTILTLLGIILLAFSVNIIEFACSIGIPQAFTKILELNQLNIPTYGFYTGLYILFYMVDDFIVFGIALYSFDKIGLTGKYSKISNLIGGILMLILGSLLIFKPQWLMFN